MLVVLVSLSRYCSINCLSCFSHAPIFTHQHTLTHALIKPTGAAFNYGALEDAGITHIVSVSPSIGEVYPQEFEYFLVFDTDDADENPQDDSLEKFFGATYDFIHDAKAQGGKVLVVCDDGISYSPVILAAFLMREEGMYRSDAMHRIKRQRTTMSLSALHQNDLKVLEKKLINEGVID